MTPRPTTIPLGTRLRDAVAILESRRVSELPVIDREGRPHGLLDIVDLVGLVSPEVPAVPAPGTAAAA
jgi:CBS domain-containing protein